MKKAVIIVSVLLAIALVSTTVLTVLVINDRKELNNNAKKIKEIETQLVSVQADSANKDKKIKELSDDIAKKDKEISKYSSKLKKKKEDEKKAAAKKAAEEASKIAEKGIYESDDNVEMKEIIGEGAKGIERTLTVKDCTKDSIFVEYDDWTNGHERIWTNGGTRVDLKNGSGVFVVDESNGGTDGNIVFKARLEIINPSTIKMTCISEYGWEKGDSHTFNKQ